MQHLNSLVSSQEEIHRERGNFLCQHHQRGLKRWAVTSWRAKVKNKNKTQGSAFCSDSKYNRGSNSHALVAFPPPKHQTCLVEPSNQQVCTCENLCPSENVLQNATAPPTDRYEPELPTTAGPQTTFRNQPPGGGKKVFYLQGGGNHSQGGGSESWSGRVH